MNDNAINLAEEQALCFFKQDLIFRFNTIIWIFGDYLKSISVLLPLLLSHFSHVWLCATPSLGFSRQENWSVLLPFPSPIRKSEQWKWSRSVMSDSSRPQGLQPTRLLRSWDFPGKSTGMGCHCLLWTPVLTEVQNAISNKKQVGLSCNLRTQSGTST